MWSRFEEVHRTRPVSMIGRERSTGFLAPWVAVEVTLHRPEVPGRVVTGWSASTDSGPLRIEGWYDGARGRVGLDLTGPSGPPARHRSRRHGRLTTPPDALAVTMTGDRATVFTRSTEQWTARATVELDEPVDPASLNPLDDWHPAEAGAATPVAFLRSGVFGQLGLRDVHVVSHADGTPVEHDECLFVTATHAGPGFHRTARCGVWSFDPRSFDLTHRADLWFRRDGVVHGDHAVHLVRYGDRWLVAASTWGSLDLESRTPGEGLRLGLATAVSEADLLTGEHVLDATPLDLPIDQLPAPVVGCWDPHFTLIDDHWHLAFVAARRFFDFYPVLARAGRPHRLADWQVLGAATDRVATEGTVIARVEDEWRVLASDGPDNPRRLRRRFPVFDLTMREVGTLDADHPTNLPWPSVVPTADGGAMMLTFDGTPVGGPDCAGVLGYGTHGDVVVLRTTSGAAASYPAPDRRRQDRR